MLFNSLAFLYFFAALLIVSFLAPSKWIKTIVLIASIIFYAYWYPPYLIVLIVSVLIDYWACIQIEDSRVQAGVDLDHQLGDHHKPATTVGKSYMIIATILNMLILFGFKYIHFAASTLGYELPADFRWALPLGISFFTFQTLACTIDVYRGQIRAKRNFWDFLLYICFFPQLIAGPILRLKQSWEEVTNPSKPTLQSFNAGIYLIFWGLIKKMLIADNLGIYVDKCFSDPAALENGFIAWIAVYCFAVQIYCDFSGYVDTALGVGRVFGIVLPINFDFPYIAKSITEFWHRWHITLSTWLKDYLYIPLGGNRKGQWRTDINLMLTMLLGGLWHGANWTFVVWGGLHGIYLAIEKLLQKNFGLVLVPKDDQKHFLKDFIKQLICFHLVCISWVFFRAIDFDSAMVYFNKMSSIDWLVSIDFEAQNMLILLALAWLGHVLNHKFNIKNQIASWRMEFRLIFLALAVVLILLFGVKQEVRFIYFDF